MQPLANNWSATAAHARTVHHFGVLAGKKKPTVKVGYSIMMHAAHGCALDRTATQPLFNKRKEPE